MIAASGTITQLIPPSLVLVVLAEPVGKSVGDMYAVPSSRASCRSGCSAYDLHRQHRRPEEVPALPQEVRTDAAWPSPPMLVAMVPSLVLIFMVLGTILLGLATPTEGGRHGRGRRDGAGGRASAPDLGAVKEGMDIPDLPPW